jgi:anti-sigma factor RsiW
MMMDCLFPPALTDFQLLKLLDGDASQPEQEHLSRCTACQARAAQLKAEMQRLSAGNYRSLCPSAMQLSEFHVGSLPDKQAALIAAHMHICPECRREIEHLAHFLAVTQAAEPKPTGALERVRVLLAELITAPGSAGLAYQPALAGVRGEAGSRARIYAADGLQISLEIQDALLGAGRKMIVGLAIGEIQPASRVTLWQAGKQAGEAALDEVGDFVFDGLGAGSYTLIFNIGVQEIHLPLLEIP